MLGLEEAKITASETLSKWKKRALACTGEAILRKYPTMRHQQLNGHIS
jgi:hypothetical protein